jgi:hypothetical protein
MPFADFYALSAFADAVEIHIREKADEAEGATESARKKRQDHRKDVFEPALVAFLTMLRDEGRLGATGSVGGREIWQATAWNDFVAGQTFRSGLGQALTGYIHIKAVHSVSSKRIVGSFEKFGNLDTATLIERNWSALCNLMDVGTTDDLAWAISDLFDQQSGETCELHMTDWKAQLMTRDGYGNPFPACDLAPIELVSAEFDMPTGQLLLTDALRVPGFREGIQFDATLEYSAFSLNSELGRTRRITAHAEHHGIGYTQTGNTCVVAHRQPDTGRIIVSARWNDDEADEDADGDANAPGWEKIGNFSCDVWRVLALDKATAVALMRAGGCTDASDTVLADYLASDDCYAKNVVSVDVQPGRWRIHSGPDFAKRVDRARFGIPNGIQPWLLLEPAALAQANLATP